MHTVECRALNIGSAKLSHSSILQFYKIAHIRVMRLQLYNTHCSHWFTNRDPETSFHSANLTVVTPFLNIIRTFRSVSLSLVQPLGYAET